MSTAGADRTARVTAVATAVAALPVSAAVWAIISPESAVVAMLVVLIAAPVGAITASERARRRDRGVHSPDSDQ